MPLLLALALVVLPVLELAPLALLELAPLVLALLLPPQSGSVAQSRQLQPS